jgi:hypothetical protein
MVEENRSLFAFAGICMLGAAAVPASAQTQAKPQPSNRLS